MPYKTTDELPDSIRNVLPLEAQNIYLTAYNSAADGSCKGNTNPEACAASMAWVAVKEKYVKDGTESGAKWVIKSAAAAVYFGAEFIVVGAALGKYLISGQLLKLDTLNGNNWGVPSTESQNLLQSLVGVPLKICSGAESLRNEHSCDYNWDNNAQIGKVVSAEQIGDWIHTKAEVTDLDAIGKIESHTWTPKWSIFTGFQDKKAGMLQGTKALSVTIVKNPAYPEAEFRAGAGLESAAEWSATEINGLPDIAFALVESCYPEVTQSKTARHLPHHNPDGSINRAHLSNALARANQIKPVCLKTTQKEIRQKALSHLQNHIKEGAAMESKEEKKTETTPKNGGAAKEILAAESTVNMDLIVNRIADKLIQNSEFIKRMGASLQSSSIGNSPADVIRAEKKAASLNKIEGTQMAEKIYTQEELDAEVKKAVAAALAGANAASAAVLENSIPKVEAEKMVSAAKASVIEEMKRDALADKIIELRASAALSVKGKEELIKKESAALMADVDLIKEMMTKIPAPTTGKESAAQFAKSTIPGDSISSGKQELDASLNELSSKYKGV